MPLTLTGFQNKTISDDVDALLALQGIGWLTRKAIALATVVVRSPASNGLS